MRQSNWIVSVALIFALPFILSTVQSETNRLTLIILGVTMLPVAMLNLYSQQGGLAELQAAVASPVPGEAQATIRDMTKIILSLGFAAVVLDVCILAGFKSGVLGVYGPSRTGIAFNVSLVAASCIILLGPLHRTIHLLVAVSPPIILMLGLYHVIDVLPVATWETLFVLICATILASVQNKALYEIARALALREKEAGKPPIVDAPTDAGAADGGQAQLQGAFGNEPEPRGA